MTLLSGTSVNHHKPHNTIRSTVVNSWTKPPTLRVDIRSNMSGPSSNLRGRNQQVTGCQAQKHTRTRGPHGCIGT